MKPRSERLRAHTAALRCALIGAEFRACPYCVNGQIAINAPRQMLLHREPQCEAFGNVSAGVESFDEALRIVSSAVQA